MRNNLRRISNRDLEYPTRRRPHHVCPSIETVRVVLAIKNFSAIPGVCHIGLGVTALNTMKVLRANGIHCEAWSAQTAKELWEKLAKDEGSNPPRPVTHVIISAPSWVQPASFGHLSQRWPDIEFVQLNHSGMAYLSIDKHGIRNIREVLEMSRSHHNIKVAGNNERFTKWVNAALGTPITYLPNLYDTTSFVNPIGGSSRQHRDTIKIGSFGASRPWKNQLTAAEAAVQLARRLDVKLELYVNSKRPDGGERMIESREELFHNLPNAKLIEVPWQLWPKFRQIVHSMDLMFSPSFDETFCVIVADGIAEGTPSVVTGAMEWAPRSWQTAEPYDPASIAAVGYHLLHDRIGAVHDGRRALTQFVRRGLQHWLDYLEQTEDSGE